MCQESTAAEIGAVLSGLDCIMNAFCNNLEKKLFSDVGIVQSVGGGGGSDCLKR